MIHPFEKMLLRALSESSVDRNMVLLEAEKLREKGYSVKEIHTLLLKMKISRIDETEESILEEAVRAFESHIDE